MNAIQVTARAVLGIHVEDVISGFEGILTAVAFDYPNSVRVKVEPFHLPGDVSEPQWFEAGRIRATNVAGG